MLIELNQETIMTYALNKIDEQIGIKKTKQD